MRFTFSWLQDFLDTNHSLAEITSCLTSIGMELESIVDKSQELSDFKVAYIIEASKHPEADKLQVCLVDTGSEKLQIVCGAPNARAGIKVVLAPVGSVIPSNGLKIRAAKIRNVDSCGMLCSESELGLGNSHDGIIELPPEAEIGSAFAPYVGADDPVIEVSITPNRGDCLGIYGIARDLAAAGMGTLKPLTIPTLETSFDSPVKIAIEDKLCHKFSGLYIKGVTNQASPLWLQNRLKAVGLRPISALVDVTNYINYAFNRPSHVYDADKLSGNLVARMARQDEQLLALNDKTYQLTTQDLVIADDSGAQGLAGIIGGSLSACNLETKNVFLEAAIFDSVYIASTCKRQHISTDASYRFERHVDPIFTEDGLKLAAKMITEICGGTVSNIELTTEVEYQPITFAFNRAKVKQLGGLEITAEKTDNILTRLGFKLVGNQITVPSWRNDVSMDADIVEEILRINGYENIPAEWLPRNSMLPAAALSPNQNRLSSVRRMLSARGMLEVITWSFMDSKSIELFAELKPELTLINPITSDLDHMRPSIAPNLLDIARKNGLRGQHNVALFEIGPVFHGTQLSEQHKMISGIRSGKNSDRSIYNDQRQVDLFDVKADLASVLQEVGLDISKLTITEEAPPYYHPARSAKMMLGKAVIGYFGDVHPAVLHKYDLKNASIFEVFAGNLPPAKPKFGRKAPYLQSDYQALERDFAFIVDLDVPAGNITRAVNNAEKTLITAVSIFDIFTGTSVGEGKKSVAVNVTLQASDHTLSEDEIDKVSANIIESVMKATGGILRK